MACLVGKDVAPGGQGSDLVLFLTIYGMWDQTST